LGKKKGKAQAPQKRKRGGAPGERKDMSNQREENESPAKIRKRECGKGPMGGGRRGPN